MRSALSRQLWRAVGTRQVRVALLGDRAAMVTCTELINAADNRGRIAATNVFEKQARRAVQRLRCRLAWQQQPPWNAEHGFAQPCLAA